MGPKQGTLLCCYEGAAKHTPEVWRARGLQQPLQQAPGVFVPRHSRTTLHQQVYQRGAPQCTLRGGRGDAGQQLHGRHRRLAVEPERLPCMAHASRTLLIAEQQHNF